MNAQSLMDEVLRHGGTLTLEGDTVKYRLPKDAAHLAGELRQCKAELMELLRKAGGRVATFPHCPRCASYALYRENNLGDFECQSCGCRDIREEIARRLM
jgi:Zn ribbon nucleic-acid-binding protein